MGVHDEAFRDIVNRYPAELAQGILGLAETPEIDRLPTELVVEFRPDCGMIVRRPGPAFALHVEHFRGRADLPRVGVYHWLYHYFARGLAVRTVVLLTDPEDATEVDPEGYGFQVQEDPPTRLPLRVLRVWEMPAAPVLANRLRALYPLVVLMADPRPKEELLREVGKAILEVTDEKAQANLAFLTRSVAQDLLGQELVAAVVGGLMEMAKQSTFYKGILEEGREEGRAQGRAQGRAEAKRGAVIAALEARFGAIPEAIQGRIAGIADEALLDALLRKAVAAPTPAAFEAEL